MKHTPRDGERGLERAPHGAAHGAASEAKPRQKLSRVRFEPFDLGPRKLLRAGKLRDNVIATAQRCALAGAKEVRALAELHEDVLVHSRSDEEILLTLRSRAAECSAAMGVSERSVLSRMAEAHTLVYAYPATIAAVESVKITMQHAKVIVSDGSGVDHRLRAEYEARCLEIAAHTSAGRLRVQAKLIALELQPRTLDEMHAIAAAQRCIWVSELPDGMAELGAVLPAALAHGIYDRVQRIATAVQREVVREEAARAKAVPAASDESEPVGRAVGRERSIGTYRADVFAELLLTGIPDSAQQAAGASGPVDSGNATMTRQFATGIQANISITIPVGGTATLEGYGPIDSITARQFAAVAPGWDSVTVNADGEVLSTERRHPTEAMKRVLRARDQHCRFPGCAVPTRSCEIDHTIEWAAGGPTELSNLGHLCPTHHLLKHPDLAHQIQWRVRQEAGGEFVWTSPTGAEYLDRPDRTLRNTPGVTKMAA